MRRRQRATFARLGVVPNHVVDAADGRATNGGVVPVMVVPVQPGVKGSASS
jgi:hypothetical protein